MLERTLARLRDSTHELAPPAGLADRVAARIAAGPPVSRSRPMAFAVIDLGRRALAVSALAAAAALACAWVSDRELDHAADAFVVSGATDPLSRSVEAAGFAP